MARGVGALKEFREFLLRGNVVELAVAVVIATAFGVLVKSAVDNLLTPLIAAIFGKPNFSQLKFTINGSTFTYGAFINALVAFILVAAAVFFAVVKPYNALQARRAQGDVPAPEPTEEVKLLAEIRDILAKEQPGH